MIRAEAEFCQNRVDVTRVFPALAPLHLLEEMRLPLQQGRHLVGIGHGLECVPDGL